MPTKINIEIDLTGDDSPALSAAKKPPPAAPKAIVQDENNPNASPVLSLLNSSPSSTAKKRRKKPRVTKSLSPYRLSRESPGLSSNSSTPIKKDKGKRSRPSSDVENAGNGRNGGKVARAVRRKNSLLSGLYPDESDDDSKSDGDCARKILSFDELTSDSDDDSEIQIVSGTSRKAKKRRAKCTRNETRINPSGHAGSSEGQEDKWLTSHHAASNLAGSDDASSESSDSDLCIKLDWWKSSKRKQKLAHLDTVANNNDKALQLLLWDVGFDFEIHPHQFEAIRFVAGFIPTFPFDEEEEDENHEEMLQINLTGSYYRKQALDPKNTKLKRSGRGMILADEMGLGKTIEALAGAALRNYPYACSSKKKQTLIITPQDGVQIQWVESLVKGGVEHARITIIGEKPSDRRDRVGNSRMKTQGGQFVICTRYKIQSEMKKMFDYSPTSAHQRNKPKSILFQNVPQALISQLRQQYLIDQGKTPAPSYRKNEPRPDRVTKIVAQTHLKKVFETVIIDEAHFLRNVLAYWGLGAAVLGAQSRRTILLSGTPFNNSNSDMSALMTFIDPHHEAARVKWWDKATSKRSAHAIVKAVSAWKNDFMLRRQKEILGSKLPPRERCVINVPLRLCEHGVYEYYEFVFLKVLNQLQNEIDDSNRRKQREMVDMMMSCMACMRMSLLHSILPKGREVTIQFSPSRKHLLKSQENNKVCVLCDIQTPTEHAEKHKAINAGEVDPEELNFRQILGAAGALSDENIMNSDDEPGANWGANSIKDDEKGSIVEIGADICRASGSDCCHFAHERCLQLFEESGGNDCPRCHDFASRLHVSGSGRKTYCQDVTTTICQQGFTASAKIEKAVEWFLDVPKSEKALILSFFKGSLDLIEGILTYEHGIQCCRYDGDVSRERRQQDLEQFKEDKSYRVLLASVPSGGTGLCIPQANHVLFLDRWYNPQIHDQAESRCNRLEQTRVVKVNTLKEGNAGVILADGTSLGQNAIMNYNELAGVIGETLKSMIAMRNSVVNQNKDEGDSNAPLLFGDDFDLESKLSEMNTLLANQKKSTAKKKIDHVCGDSEDDGCSDDDDSVNSEGNVCDANANLSPSIAKSKWATNSPHRAQEKSESDSTNNGKVRQGRLSFDSSVNDSDDDMLCRSPIISSRGKYTDSLEGSNMTNADCKMSSSRPHGHNKSVKTEATGNRNGHEVIDLCLSDEEMELTKLEKGLD